MGIPVVLLKLNEDGLREILNGGDCRRDILRRAEAIRDAAGEGYEVLESQTDRFGAVVVTASFEARLNESEGRGLTAALGAGRR